MAQDIDFAAIDHADEVMEYLNVPTSGLSYQDRTEMGRRLLQMAALRMAAEQAQGEQASPRA